MKIWRVIAHRNQGEEALQLMKEKNRIAIGWTDVGDLRNHQPKNSDDIAKLIRTEYPTLKNSHTGGPSLWHLYNDMEPGDLVIVNYDGIRRCVFEVVGDYFYDNEDKIFDYGHQRAAFLTDISAEKLWREQGASLASGENNYMALALCSKSEKESLPSVYFEGEKFAIKTTAYERNPEARAACLQKHGYICAVCDFDFENTYGEIGKNYIHVHHRTDLSLSKGPISTDPEKDLVPLCPNCHAMVHKVKPAMPVDKLKRIVDENKANATAS